MVTDLGYYDYCGVLHIHTRHSDGSGTVKKIIKAAEKSDLDYMVITDHNTLQAMEDGMEGWYHDLLVLVGEEIGEYYKSHYLAFGISDVITPSDHQDIEVYIEAVKRQGGIGFVAHPNGLNIPTLDLRLSPCKDLNLPDYTGLEIWSYMPDWAENVSRFNIPYYYLRPEMAIDGPPPKLLRRWDQLCLKRRVVGIGGADAHASHLSSFNFLKFLSYRRAFRGIRTHLITYSPLVSDLDKSKKIIYSALEAGHCFFAHDFLSDSTGFSFTATTDEPQELLMGDEVSLKSGAEKIALRLEVKSPKNAAIRLLCNGQLIEEVANTRNMKWGVSKKGGYRVEAYYNGKPWVFTNPIYLR